MHAPDVQAAKHAQYNSSRAASSGGPRQSTNEVLMVAPTAFGFNAQAAADNSFMHASTGDQTSLPTNQLRSRVLNEFSGLHRELTEVSSSPNPKGMLRNMTALKRPHSRSKLASITIALGTST